MTDEVVRLEQLGHMAAAAALARIVDEFSAARVPDAALVAGLSNAMAKALVAELRDDLPLDGPKARAVCVGLLTVLLGAVVGAATPQRLPPLPQPPAQPLSRLPEAPA